MSFENAIKSLVVSTELTTVHCGKCGGTYAIDARYHQHKQENGGCWTCPYCECSWGFSKDGSEMARLKRKLEYQEAQAERGKERLKRKQAELDLSERRRRATKAAHTRTKNRVAKGICPCCNRHFANLQQHMENQHPDFVTTDDDDENEMKEG